MSRTVCLIQPPANLAGTKSCLDDTQFGLGLLSLSAWLETNGFRAVGLHVPLAQHHGFSMDEVIHLISSHEPMLIAIGLNWVHFSVGAVELAQCLKQALPGTPIVVGGQHASLFAGEIARLHADAIDGVIVGEAEIPLLAICRSLQEQGRIADDVPGFVRGDGRATAPALLQDLDALPLYSYRALRPRPKQENVAALNTTRGACPFRCSWCIEPVVGRVQGRPKLSFRSAGRIADQIEALLKEGIDRFTIQDGFFIGGDRKLIELADAILSRSLPVQHINVFAHPDSFSKEGFSALAFAASQASVDFGVETGSVEVARRNHRDLDPDAVVLAVTAAREANVIPYTWWMVGLPGEGDAQLSETERLLLQTMDAGGIPRWVSPLILLPGTPIHEDPEGFGVQVRFRTFTDYARFSTTSLAEAVLFADLSTHHEVNGAAGDSAHAAQRLRRFIASNFDLVTRHYQGSESMRGELRSAQERVKSSFF
jgi:radical SAM superfamily enzyme YgiQ (UPF0313 family)